MKNLNNIAEELFNKIRGRFPKVTIGDADSVITNEPSEGRFFDFEINSGEKVNVSIDEDKLTVMYNNKMSAKDAWYDFLRELRQFSKKRMLDFDTRDITKANLDKSDYEYLSKERSGETTMSETKMYGTSRTSFQNIGDARMVIKHSEPVNQELASGRSQKIHSIYIESASGERFKYPFKHLNGARAVARHVSEGGNLYDDIGQHIVGLSEELNKLRKFKTYMNRSTVMAEGLSGYMDVVYDRISTVKKTVESLQKSSSYKEFVENFEPKESVEVPEDVQSDWIDQLTIRQFNEELKGVFPYIYKLVSEANAVQELGPDDLNELDGRMIGAREKHGAEYMKKAAEAGRKGASQEELGKLKDKYSKAEKKTKEEAELEETFEEMMGQFGEGERHGNSKIYDKCWKGYRKVPGKKAGEKGSCKKIEGVELESLDSFFEGRDDAPEGDRITTDENPLVTTYDDEFDQGKPGISGHMNLKTYMSIMGISEKYQDMLAKAVLDGGRGKKISVPDEVKADYDAEREEEDLKPRALWIELSQHHEAEKESDNANEDVQTTEGFVVVDMMKTKDGMKVRPMSKIFDTEEEANEFKANNPRTRSKSVMSVDQARQQLHPDSKLEGNAKVKGPDGDEITLEKESKTPLGEFILSYFDRESGQFPKGETAVLTMIEKDYGEEFIEPAKQFMEAINDKIAEMQGYKEADEFEGTSDLERIRGLAGL